MLPLLLPLAFATPTPNLDIDGACPGPMTVHVDHASPNARLAIAHAAGLGSFIIPNGRCAGVNLGLAAPAIAVTGQASAGGEKTWTPTLAAPACGRWLVAIDLDTCRASAPMPVTPPPTDRWDITLDFAAIDGAVHIARDTSWVVTATDPGGGTALIRISDTGDVLSSRTTPASIRTLIAGPTGLLAIGSETFDPALQGYGFESPLFMSLDGALQPRWTNRFDEPGNPTAGAIGPGGELYAGGELEVLMDTTGSVLWTRYSSGRINNAEAAPGGFISSGWRWRNGNGDHDATVRRTALDGSTVWEVSLNRQDRTSGQQVLPLGEDTLVLIADQRDSGTTLVRLDRSGAVQWARNYTSPGAAYLGCHDIVPAWAGYGLVCTTIGPLDELLDTVLIKIDTEGEVQYARTYGPGWLAQGHVAGNLGMVLIGSDLNNAPRVIRVDANGQTGCDQPFDVTGTPVTVTAALEPPFVSPSAPPLSHPAVTLMASNVAGLDVCF